MNLEKALDTFKINDISSETEETLKRKYKRLMIKYHPDNYKGDDTKAKEISLALEILKDALKKLQEYKLINNKQEIYNIVIPLNKLIHLYSGENITITYNNEHKVLSNNDIQKHNTLIILDTTITHNGIVTDFSNIQHWSISDNYMINCELYVENINNSETILIRLENYENEFTFSSQAISVRVQLPFNISVDVKITKKLRVDNNK